jgi:beta-galactosidase
MVLHNKAFLKLFLLFLIVSLNSCKREITSAHFRNADFNSQWRFHMGDINDPSSLELDEMEWIPVNLPHDWSIIDYKVQDSLHAGPFYKNLPGGADVGYLRDGIGWYK